jgi:hypothetical protein
LHHLFINIGLNSSHNHGLPVLQEINDYDAFTDRDPSDFKLFYEKYQNSLFILNTRPMKKWLISRYKHARFHNFIERWHWPVSNEKTINWINLRDNHYRNVVDFFKDKNKKLIIVNIEKKGWNNFIINNVKNVNNVNLKSNECNDKEIADKIQFINDNVLSCLKLLNYSPDELFIKNDNILNYQYKFYL